MDKNYITEFEILPDDHPNAMDHECFKYPSHYDYLDTFNKTYHWDKFADDSDSDMVNLGLKFRGEAINNIMQEVLPFSRETGKTGYVNDLRFAHNAYFFHKMEVRGFDHVGYKEKVKPHKHPTLTKMVEWFEFESDVQPLILEKNIGNWEIWHVDNHCGHPGGYRQQELVRVLIHLQDWEFGQMLLWGTQPIVQWQAGDVLAYDVDMPHCSANSSRHRRYTLRLTGVPSQATKDKLAAGGIVNVDEL